MENKFANAAVENFKNGYSCSESVAKAAVDLGYAPKELIDIATSFSGGMSSGCLCGAIAGSQLILGYTFGKNKSNTARALAPEGASAHVANVRHGSSSSLAPIASARALAKEFLDEFKSIHKAACCRILTKGFDFHSPERKNHCINMVADCARILDKIMQRELTKV